DLIRHGQSAGQFIINAADGAANVDLDNIVHSDLVRRAAGRIEKRSLKLLYGLYGAGPGADDERRHCRGDLIAVPGDKREHERTRYDIEEIFLYHFVASLFEK